MAKIAQFKLPDVGEGLTEAEIVSWKVKPGDIVAVNDVVVEIETAKSLVELPCPFAGVVTELLADEGGTVLVGTPIISVDTDSSGAPRATAGAEDMVPAIPVPDGTAAAGLIGGPAPGGRTSVLVGYGPRTTDATRRPRKASALLGPPPVVKEALHEAFTPAPSPAPLEPAARVLAKPPVRQLAKSLGVDLSDLHPSGPGGVVTRADVEAAAGPRAPLPAAAGARAEEARETRIPVRGVRRLTAQAMVASAFSAPHVTEWVSVDVTRSMRLIERLRAEREFKNLRVSPLLLVAKSLLLALRRHPGINAAWNEAAQEIVEKHYVNLGIAAATPRGLMVPNIKDADRLDLPGLARAIGELAATAKEGRTPPSEMQGGTITITNVGVFGVDAGTPILNPPEAAILCLGAIREMPWVHKGKVRPRQVTQLALSFDHRLVDGELGSRFLSDIAAMLEDPARAMVWG